MEETAWNIKFNFVSDQGDQGKPGEPGHRNIGRGSCYRLKRNEKPPEKSLKLH
jgi:hypothetical protein